MIRQTWEETNLILAEAKRPVVAMGRDYPPGTVVPPHEHPHAQLVHASAGVMRVTTETGIWVVPPQRAVWVPAHVTHSVAMHGRVEMRTVYIAPAAAEGLPGACCVVAVPALLRELILRAMTLPAEYDEGSPAARVMDLILDEIRALPAAPLHLPQGQDARLRRVTTALLDAPGDSRGFEVWAKTAGASPRTLARLFQSETGLSFRAWRQQARMLQALTWLAEGRPVTGLALDLGYDSPSAFVAAFKRAFGVTPARYFKGQVSNEGSHAGSARDATGGTGVERDA